jgi:hypothetical protein
MWRTRLSVLLPHLTICELLAIPERRTARTCARARCGCCHRTRFRDLRLAVCPEEVRWDAETNRRFPFRLPVTW